MCARPVGRPAAGARLPAEPQSGARQHPEREAGAAQHDQLVVRPADRIPDLRVAADDVVQQHERAVLRRDGQGVQSERRIAGAGGDVDQVRHLGRVTYRHLGQVVNEQYCGVTGKEFSLNGVSQALAAMWTR